jgi:N12 class adenine-specific DNA methylase
LKGNRFDGEVGVVEGGDRVMTSMNMLPVGGKFVASGAFGGKWEDRVRVKLDNGTVVRVTPENLSSGAPPAAPAKPSVPFVPSAAATPESKLDEEAAAAKARGVEMVTPQFTEGQRVTWITQKGTETSGTVRSQDGENVRIRLDKTILAGGVPIAGVVTVKASKLRPVEGTAAVPLTPSTAESTIQPESEAADVQRPQPAELPEGTTTGERPSLVSGTGLPETPSGIEPERPLEPVGAGPSGEGSAPGGRTGRAGIKGIRGEGTRLPRPVPEAGERPSKPVITSRPSKKAGGSDYVITGDEGIGDGGLKSKFRQNIEAIRLLKMLESEGRLATPEEQRVLVRYTGWGQFKETVFTERHPEWEAERTDLEALLTKEELDAASASTVNAHYTSIEVIRAMYEGIERMGITPETAARVLEPALGIGHFFGAMPKDLLAESTLLGIELDSLTARIAKQLYQNASVTAGAFETVRLPRGHFDLVITNVPFSETKPYDREYDKFKLNLHNYFIVRSLDLTRPNGIVAVITSRYTMDSTTQDNARAMMANKAELLGAFRLPRTAFKKNAGTEVVTDILFFRRLGEGEKPTGAEFSETVQGQVQEDGTFNRDAYYKPHTLNEYWLEHPENIIGKLDTAGTMYRSEEISVAPPEKGTVDGALRDRLLSVLPKDIATKAEAPVAEEQAPIIPTGTVKPFQTVVQDGKVYVNQITKEFRNEADVLIREFKLVEKAGLDHDQVQLVGKALGVRDIARELINLELRDESPEQIRSARGQLNSLYDSFVRKFGRMNTRAVTALLYDDPDLPLLQALENIDRDTKKITKSDMFTKQTVNPRARYRDIKTARDAVLASLAEKGRIDWPFMSEVAKKPEEQLILEAQADGLVFLNPEGAWEDKESYLSGNVRRKLEVAKGAALTDKQFNTNVQALEKVQPARIPVEDIEFKLSGSWIQPKVVKGFIIDLLGGRKEGVAVKYVRPLNLWTVSVSSDLQHSVKNLEEFGTNEFGADTLIEHALNLKDPIVKKPERQPDGSSKDVMDQAETDAARDKTEKIQAAFRNWVLSNSNVADVLAEDYNFHFNSYRNRAFDGSHLTLPGLAPGVELRPAQKDTIWMNLQRPNTLDALEVGLGKSLILMGTAVESRRLGMKKKPMLVVHNATLAQYRTDFPRYFPGAKLLIAAPEDLKGPGRKRFMSRVATGDWDAVVVAHSSFKLLPVSPGAHNRYLQKRVDELRRFLAEELKTNDRESRRKVEQKIARLLAKMRRKTEQEAKDITVYFDELGVDSLLVDEADEFKNLEFETRLNRVAGLGSKEGSGRASDLFMKAEMVKERNNGGGLIFATGTPISNSLAEMHGLMRYLAPEILAELGIEHFDGFIGTFASPVSGWEPSTVDPSVYRQVTRLAEFANLPELIRFFRSFTTVRTGEETKIVRPDMETKTHYLQPSKELARYIREELMERAKRVAGKKPEKGADNILVIQNDGKDAALDMRLVVPGAPHDTSSKLSRMVEDAFATWKATRVRRGVILIAMDRGSPRGKSKKEAITGFNAYRWLRDALVKKGVPREEIAFAQDYISTEKKEAMADKVNKGEIRILLGSTSKMGTGLNVQKKVTDLIHGDFPWRPRDITQRDGRMWRFGNENKDVRRHFYVVEKTYDSYQLQLLLMKQKMVDQALSEESVPRRMEDISGRALTFAEMQALSTGNPLVLERFKVEDEARKLNNLETTYESQKNKMQYESAGIPQQVEAREKEIKKYAADKAKYDKEKPEEFQMDVDGKSYAERKGAGEAVIALVNKRSEQLQAPLKELLNKLLKAGAPPAKLREQKNQLPAELIGTYAGFPIYLEMRSRIDDIERIFDQKTDTVTYKWEVKTDHPDLYFQGKSGNVAINYNPDSGVGTIQSLVSQLEGIEDRIKFLEKQNEESVVRKADLEKLMKRPFEYKDRLAQVEGRLASIYQELQVKKSDIGSAGGEAEEEPENPPEEDESGDLGPSGGEGPGTPARGQTDVSSSSLRQLADSIARQAKLEKAHSLSARVSIAERIAEKSSAAKSKIMQAIEKAKAAAAAFSEWYMTAGLTQTDFKDAQKNLNWAYQKADFDARKLADAIKEAMPDKDRREALTNWIEADGNEELLRDRAEKSKGKAKRGYELALQLTEPEKLIARNINNTQDALLAEAINAGMLEHGVDLYMMHIWKRENKLTKRVRAEVNASLLQPNPSFTKKRVWGTYFEGEQLGAVPVDKDAGFLVAARDSAFKRAMGARAFIKQLSKGNASDGRPLAAVSGSGRAIEAPEGGAEAYFIKPRSKPEETYDYRVIDHPALRKWKWAGKDENGAPIFLQGDMLVHPEIYQQLKNMLGRSWFRTYTIPKTDIRPFAAALAVGREAKSTLLSLSGFHQVQTGTHGAFHEVSPFPGGTEPLDLEDPLQAKLVRNGVMAVHTNMLQEFSEGVAASGLTNRLPIIGKRLQNYQTWLFGEYIPRLKMQMAVDAYKRNKARYPNLTDDQVAELTANQANAAFGEQNLLMMARNPTFQDFLRFTLLAPDFLEARARFAGQAAKPYGREQAAALMRGALALYVLSRILNKILDDDYHFDWHDLFSVIYKGERYTLRSVPGDVLHLFSDPRGFVYNRLNPLYGKGLVEGLTGRDRFGRQRKFTDLAEDLIKGLAPIPTQGLIRDYEARPIESLLSAQGIGTSKYRTPAERKALELATERTPKGRLSDEQIEQFQLLRKYRNQIEQGKFDKKAFFKDVDAGKISDKDAESIAEMTETGVPPQLERDFKRLTVEEALEVWGAASLKERDRLVEPLIKKADSLDSKPQVIQDQLYPKLEKAIREYAQQKRAASSKQISQGPPLPSRPPVQSLPRQPNF